MRTIPAIMYLPAISSACLDPWILTQPRPPQYCVYTYVDKLQPCNSWCHKELIQESVIYAALFLGYNDTQGLISASLSIIDRLYKPKLPPQYCKNSIDSLHISLPIHKHKVRAFLQNELHFNTTRLGRQSR